MDDIEILGYKEYVTADRDTFDLIAWKEYGDEMLASLLMNSNLDYADVLMFEPGLRLALPVIERLKVQQIIPPWRQ